MSEKNDKENEHDEENGKESYDATGNKDSV